MTSNNKIQVHYALQTCDTKSFQIQKRFCSDSKTEVVMKCVVSFFNAVRRCSIEKPNSHHTVAIIDDHSHPDMVNFLKTCISVYTSDNLKIEFIPLTDKTGIRASIRECYLWLQNNGKDFVYQVQDDYMFLDDAIIEMIDTWFQMHAETGTHAIMSPWNDKHSWLSQYRNRATPRTVIVGKTRYWIQFYDCSCSWLTSHQQFSQHWDLYETFFYLITKVTPTNGDLENKSLNYMFSQRQVLGLCPVDKSLAFHMQSELEKDPHVDWKPIWDSIDINIR